MINAEHIKKVAEAILACTNDDTSTCCDACSYNVDSTQTIVCKPLLEDVAKALTELLNDHNELVEMYTKLAIHAQDLHRERQPVKAQRLEEFYTDVLARCGNCGAILSRHWKACPKCTKKIDWSDIIGLGSVRTDT